ncbi:MAG: anti-sigma factor family protein [Thermoguttaceae bacterium]
MEILDWNELVDPYVDGELSDEEARQVEERSQFDAALRSQIDWTRRLRRLFENSKSPFPKDYENRLQESLRNSDAWNAIDARRAKAVSSASKRSRRTRAKNWALIAASVAAIFSGVALFSDATLRRDFADYSDRLLALNSTKDSGSARVFEQSPSVPEDKTIGSEEAQETNLDEETEPLQSVDSGTLMSADMGDTAPDSRALGANDLQSPKVGILGDAAPASLQMDSAMGLSASPTLGSARVNSTRGFSARSAGRGSFREGATLLSSAPPAVEISMESGVDGMSGSALEDDTSGFTLRRDARRLSQKEYWIKVSFAGSAELRAQMSEIEQICEEEGIRYLQNGGKGEARLVNVAPTQMRRLTDRLGVGATRDVKVSRALQEWAQTPSEAPAKENLKDVLLVFHLQSEAGEESAGGGVADGVATDENGFGENAE